MEQNLQSNPICFSTEHFLVEVGESPYVGPESGPHPRLYLLINRATNVLEAETRLYVQAIDWCMTMEKQITRVLKEPTSSLEDAVDTIPDVGPPGIPPGKL